MAITVLLAGVIALVESDAESIVSAFRQSGFQAFSTKCELKDSLNTRCEVVDAIEAV